MENALFLQSETTNPYEFYAKMRMEQPVYWDDRNQVLAIYSYQDCYFLLNSNLVEIPQVSSAHLNKNAAKVIENLARLSNSPAHSKAKEAAFYLFEKLKSINVSALLGVILTQTDLKSFDFVETIAKKLPALTLLKGFGFEDTEIELILPKVATLVQLLFPNKSEQQIAAINGCIDEVFFLVEKHLVDTKILDNKTLTDAYVSNLIGLLIQSYDAGRGLLCNTLLQMLSAKSDGWKDENDIRNVVIETIRFDSPIQNTRRKLTEDLVLRNQELKKGEQILLVLASANRDILKFENPDVFDIHRKNNNDSLTFGTGMHACLAKYFSVNLACQTLNYFYNTFENISLIGDEIEFEPMINVRLAKEILISVE